MAELPAGWKIADEPPAGAALPEGWKVADTSAGGAPMPAFDAERMSPDEYARYTAAMRRALISGATFGFSDRAESALRSLFGAKYDDTLAQIRTEQAALKASDPLAYYGANIVGSLTMPVGAIGKVAEGVTAAARAAGASSAVAKSAGLASAGGGMGAASGAGTVEDYTKPIDAAKNVAVHAVVGAGAAPVIYGLAGKAGDVLSWTGDKARNAMTLLSGSRNGVERMADDEFRRSLAAGLQNRNVIPSKGTYIPDNGVVEGAARNAVYDLRPPPVAGEFTPTGFAAHELLPGLQKRAGSTEGANLGPLYDAAQQMRDAGGGRLLQRLEETSGAGNVSPVHPGGWRGREPDWVATQLERHAAEDMTPAYQAALNVRAGQGAPTDRLPQVVDLAHEFPTIRAALSDAIERAGVLNRATPVQQQQVRELLNWTPALGTPRPAPELPAGIIERAISTLENHEFQQKTGTAAFDAAAFINRLEQAVLADARAAPNAAQALALRAEQARRKENVDLFNAMRDAPLAPPPKMDEIRQGVDRALAVGGTPQAHEARDALRQGVVAGLRDKLGSARPRVGNDVTAPVTSEATRELAGISDYLSPKMQALIRQVYGNQRGQAIIEDLARTGQRAGYVTAIDQARSSAEPHVPSGINDALMNAWMAYKFKSASAANKFFRNSEGMWGPKADAVIERLAENANTGLPKLQALAADIVRRRILQEKLFAPHPIAASTALTAAEIGAM